MHLGAIDSGGKGQEANWYCEEVSIAILWMRYIPGTIVNWSVEYIPTTTLMFLYKQVRKQHAKVTLRNQCISSKHVTKG